jgi:hypothetical protein
VAAFKPVADEAKPLLQLGTNSGAEAVKDVAEAAGKRLQELCQANEAVVRAKLKSWMPKMERPWSFTNIEQNEIHGFNASCKAMAATEKEFQEALIMLNAAWPGAEILRRESADRSALYEGLAADCVIPKWIRIS